MGPSPKLTLLHPPLQRKGHRFPVPETGPPIRIDVQHGGAVGLQAMAGVLKIEDPLQFARIMEAVRAKQEKRKAAGEKAENGNAEMWEAGT